MALGDIDTECAGAEVPWEDICNRLKMEPRMELFLQLFKDQFSITSSIEALAQIPTFLGDYMVRDFDYKGFCIALGSIDETLSADDTLWTAHMSNHLTEDLVAATSLMLRLAMTIAKAHQLESSDWTDINEACSNAVRTLPACYRLQRALPGAVSTARAWRHLPEGPEEISAHSGNPWESEDNQKTFEEMFHFPFVRIEAISESDGHVEGGLSGRFRVVEVNDVDGISLVSLEILHIGATPAGFPMKPSEKGDVVMWEVESSLGSFLEAGLCIEADYYGLNNSSGFISSFASVAPEWAP